MSKITLATFKKFIKNPACQIKVCSSFDGTTDCCESVKDDFTLLSPDSNPHENNLGISGIWLVFGSRDRFRPYSEDGFTGIEVYNCCGHFIVALPDSNQAPKPSVEPASLPVVASNEPEPTDEPDAPNVMPFFTFAQLQQLAFS